MLFTEFQFPSACSIGFWLFGGGRVACNPDIWAIMGVGDSDRPGFLDLQEYYDKDQNTATRIQIN